MGAFSGAIGTSSIAIGGDSSDGDSDGAQALAENAIALGADALVTSGSTDAVTIGRGASATSANALAIGATAVANNFGVAIGQAASANGNGSVAFGSASVANNLSTAIGRGAVGTDQSVAVGWGANAALNATALGMSANASGNVSVAVGRTTTASGSASTALGHLASATQSGSTALGFNAKATQANSTAIGANATTTAANQVTIGGTGSAVRIGDIAASTAAQTGPVQAVTVDGNGVLGRQAVATAAAVDNIRVSMNALSAISEAQFNALSDRVTGLDFRLEDVDQRARGGIAAAAALGSAIAMPDKDFVIAGNVATYGGEQCYALTFVGRASDSLAFTAGIAGNSGDGDVIAQAGFALGF